jgi:trehalose 6-phosphate synthase
VPVVAALLRTCGGTWIYASDRGLTRSELSRPSAGGDFIDLRPLALPEGPHRAHYEIASNAVLARVLHGVLPGGGRAQRLMAELDRAWSAYVDINRRFASAVSGARACSCSCVFVEDSHLMLVGAKLRRMQRDACPVSYFHHVAWCPPQEWAVLPARPRAELLAGLLANDSVGFHAHQWADNFLACCAEFLPDAVVGDDHVEYDERRCEIHVDPAPVDAETVRERARTRETMQWRDRIRAIAAGRTLVVRVDRADVWKNPLRGFLAYESLLARRPDLARSTVFFAALTRTREWIPEYREYADAISSTVARINERFRSAAGGRDVVVLDFASDAAKPDAARALATLAEGDVVLVNPVRDGLNLVAKEAVLVGTRHPALVLATSAGVHEQLEPWVLGHDALSVASTSIALERAVHLDIGERRRRHLAMLRAVERGTPKTWATQRFAAASRARAARDRVASDVRA